VLLLLAACSGGGDGGELRLYVAEYDLPHGYSRLSVYSVPQLEYLGKVETNSLGARIAVSPDRRQLWVSGESSQDFAVVSTANDSLLRRMPVGRRLGLATFDPQGERILVCNSAPISRREAPNAVSIVEVPSGRVLRHVEVGHKPRGACFGPEGRRGYVANLGDDTISVIDVETGELLRTVSTGAGPYHLSADPAGRWLYVACVGAPGETGRERGALAIHALPGLELLASVEAGDHPSRALPTPDGELLVVSQLWTRSGDDCHLRLLRVGEEAGAEGPRPRFEPWRELDAGISPLAGDISPDGRWFAVSDFGAGSLALVDLKRGKVARRIDLAALRSNSFSVDAVFGLR